MCNYCKTGVYNLCLDIKISVTPPIDGNLCMFVVDVIVFSVVVVSVTVIVVIIVVVVLY